MFTFTCGALTVVLQGGSRDIASCWQEVALRRQQSLGSYRIRSTGMSSVRIGVFQSNWIDAKRALPVVLVEGRDIYHQGAKCNIPRFVVHITLEKSEIFIILRQSARNATRPRTLKSFRAIPSSITAMRSRGQRRSFFDIKPRCKWSKRCIKESAFRHVILGVTLSMITELKSASSSFGLQILCGTAVIREPMIKTVTFCQSIYYAASRALLGVSK